MRYLFEDYALDTDRRELQRATDVIVVTPQVLDLLDYLIRNRDRVVTKDDLINAVWNGGIVSDAALTTRLNAARTAISDTGEKQRLIKTLPRKGFRFVGTVQEGQRPADPASSWAEKSMRENPNFLLAVCMFAASNALAGRLEQAQGGIARALQSDPGLRASNLRDLAPFRRAADLDLFARGLRNAGLLE